MKYVPLQNLMKTYVQTNIIFVIKDIFFGISTQSQTSLKITEASLEKYMRFQILTEVNITITASGFS
jgi:hypothetical protein